MFGITFKENSSWITAQISWRFLEHFSEFISEIGAEEKTRLVGKSTNSGNKIYYFRIDYHKLGYTFQGIETLYLKFLQRRGGSYAA